MKVIRKDEAECYEPQKDWRRLSLCSEKEISLEHFVKPPDHRSPRHEHPNAQVLVVLEGELTIMTDSDGETTVGVGDAAFIPGGETHVVANPRSTPSVGLDIFVPGRSFDFWKNRLKP
jgi:quercetin dioxygenase-like cupin family protein